MAAWHEQLTGDLFVAVQVIKLQRKLYALKWWQFRARRRLVRELIAMINEGA